MKNALSQLIIALFAIVTFAGCRPDDATPPTGTKGKLNLKVEVTANGQPLNFGSTYNLPGGKQYIIELFKFYLGNISLVKNDNSEVLLKDVVLVDLNKQVNFESVSRSFTFEVEQGTYKALKTGIGVPENLNVVKNTYPNDHPLSINRGTDWDWAGYMFIMLEGRARNSTADPLSHFEYHIADNEFYTEKTINKPIEITAGSTSSFVLNLDAADLFVPSDTTNKIDLIQENFSHSESDEEKKISRKVVNNLNAGLGK